MKSLKPGTIVMKIAMGNYGSKFTLPIGTLGEILPTWEDCLNGYSIVFFPSMPSPFSKDKGWMCESRLLMALNDPDMDITETEEEDLGEFV